MGKQIKRVDVKGFKLVEVDGKIWDMQNHSFSVRSAGSGKYKVCIAKAVNYRNGNYELGGFDAEGFAIGRGYVSFVISSALALALLNFKKLG